MPTKKYRFLNFIAAQKLLVFYTILFFPLLSCSAMQLKPDPSNPIKRIAVLPLDNRTTQKKGAENVRREVIKRLDKLYYEVLPMEKTDKILKKNGFSIKGTDYKKTDLEKLKKAFDVEGVFFGTLLNYNVRKRGELVVKEVAGQFWLVDLTKKDELWQGSLGIISESLLDRKTTYVDSEENYEQESQMTAVSPEEIPFGNVDMNFPNDFGRRAKYAGFEENSKAMPEWVKSDFCTEPLRTRFLEEDITKKLTCEVGELIQRVTWTFPVGPGSLEN